MILWSLFFAIMRCNLTTPREINLNHLSNISLEPLECLEQIMWKKDLSRYCTWVNAKKCWFFLYETLIRYYWSWGCIIELYQQKLINNFRVNMNEGILACYLVIRIHMTLFTPSNRIVGVELWVITLCLCWNYSLIVSI